MKKLLVLLLALGSISSFASLTKCKIDVSETEGLDKIYLQLEQLGYTLVEEDVDLKLYNRMSVDEVGNGLYLYRATTQIGLEKKIVDSNVFVKVFNVEGTGSIYIGTNSAWRKANEKSQRRAKRRFVRSLDELPSCGE